MAFSDQTALIDAATRELLTDPVQLRPAGSAEADWRVVPAMIDEPVEAQGMPGIGAPMLQATIQVLVADAVLARGDIALPGSWLDGIEGGTFVPMALGWRVAGAPTKDDSGRWQTAAIERYRA